MYLKTCFVFWAILSIFQQSIQTESFHLLWFCTPAKISVWKSAYQEAVLCYAKLFLFLVLCELTSKRCLWWPQGFSICFVWRPRLKYSICLSGFLIILNFKPSLSIFIAIFLSYFSDLIDDPLSYATSPDC